MGRPKDLDQRLLVERFGRVWQVLLRYGEFSIPPLRCMLASRLDSLVGNWLSERVGAGSDTDLCRKSSGTLSRRIGGSVCARDCPVVVRCCPVLRQRPYWL